MGAASTMQSGPTLEFPQLPERWIATALEALPALASDIESQIRAEVAEYGHDPKGVVHANVHCAVQAALQSFVRGLAGQQAEQHREVFRRLGRLEAESGRSHDTLQMAYRVATHQVAEFLALVGRQIGATPAQQADVRHAAIAFVEHLASLSRAGYEEAEAIGVADAHAVTRLLELLVQPGEATRTKVAARARQVGWDVPERVVALEMVPEGAFRPDLVRMLRAKGGTSLVVGRLPGRCVGFADAATDLSFVPEFVPAAASAVLGPAVRLSGAAASARIAYRFSRRGPSLTGPLVTCDDRLLTLFGGDAADVMAALAQSRLQPLEELGIVRRLKAARVLSALLEYGGLPRDAPELADISPSTLQYRKNMVEEMFGSALRDRDRRLELILALRAVLPQWEAELAMHDRRTEAKRARS